MNPNDVKDIVELLIQMGGALADAGFEIALRRAVVNAWITLGWGCFLVAATVGFSLLAKRFYAKIPDQGAYDEDENEAFVALFLVLAAVLFIMAIGTFASFARAMAVPEWEAIKLLMGLVN